MEESGLKLVAEGANQFFSDMDKAAGSVDKFADTTDKASKKVGGMEESSGRARGGISQLGSVAGAVAGAGLGLLIGAVGGVVAGLVSASERAAEFRAVLGKDFPSDQIAAITDEVALLERRFGVGLPEQMDAARQLVANGLAPDFEAAMDIITAGFDAGINVGDDLLDTLREYPGYFSNLGFSADEMLSILNRGLEAGARNSDFVADAVKEFGILIREPATLEAVGALDAKTGDLVKSFQEGKSTGEETFNAILERLGAIEDPILRNTLGVEIFGTKWEDLGETAMLALGKTDEGLVTSAGAAEEAGNRIASFGEIIPRVMDKLSGLFGPLSEQALAFANEHWPAVEEALENGVAIGGDLIAAFGGDDTALSRLPGVLQNVVGAVEAVGGAVEAVQGGVDAFFKTPLGTEIQEGAAVVADYFNGPFQENLSNGVAVVQGKLDEFAASDWGQRIQAGATVVADYMANDFASDFQAGVQVASDALAPFVESAETNFNASLEAASIVADYMMNEFPTDFQAGVDLVVGFVTGLPGQVQAGWDGMVTGAKTAVDDMISGITAGAGRALNAGRAFVDNIRDGVVGAFDDLLAEARRKLQELADMLPGSEPKDTSSPLYGLGRRGDALVGNFAAGVLESAALAEALDAVTRQGREALEEFVAEVDRIAGEAVGGALGVRRGGIAAIGMQLSSQAGADKALADAQQAIAGGFAAQEKGAKDAARIREEARAKDMEAAEEIAAIEAEAARLRRTAATNLDADARDRAAQQAAELELELIELREERGVAAAEAEAAAKEREAEALAEVLRLQDLAVDKNMEYVAYTEQNAKTQAAINEALAQSQELAKVDPVAANQYLGLRQRQIKEIADFQLKADLAQDDRTKALIAQQQELLAQAQQIEAAQLAESIRARAGELGAAGRAVTTQVASTIAASTSYTTVGSGNTINVNGAGAGAAQLAQMLLAILNGQAGRADIFARTQ